MNTLFIDLFNKVSKMTKPERIMRIIELSGKQLSGQSLDMMEELELYTIQEIRRENGEIDKVLQDRGDDCD